MTLNLEGQNGYNKFRSSVPRLKCLSLLLYLIGKKSVMEWVGQRVIEKLPKSKKLKINDYKDLKLTSSGWSLKDLII